MGRRQGVRFRNGLPRGGLGYLGWIPGLGSFAVAWLVRADIAIPACLLVVPVCVWCALGLRKDDSAGELSDHYVDDESINWTELMSGNFEYQVRRQSNGLILLGVASFLIALCRWWFGWGPLALL